MQTRWPRVRDRAQQLQDLHQSREAERSAGALRSQEMKQRKLMQTDEKMVTALFRDRDSAEAAYRAAEGNSVTRNPRST